MFKLQSMLLEKVCLTGQVLTAAAAPVQSNIINSRVGGCRPAQQAGEGGGKEGGNRLALLDWLECARRSLHVWKLLLS